jgi:outer membrane lipoprotein-sorting protein
MKLLRAFVLFFALSCCAASTHAAPRGEDLLHAMMSARRTASYTATETTIRTGAATVVAKVQRHGPKKRIEYSAPPIMKGDVLVDNGTTVWRYHKAENSVVKTKTVSREDTPDFRELRRRFDAKTQGQTRIGGRKAWIVAITPRGKSQVLRKFWVDDKSKIRLRSELFDARGRRIETRTLSNLKFGKVSDTAFHFTPPRGAEVTNAGTLYTQLHQAQRHADWLRVPSQLPLGYAFESAVVDESKKESWLRYTSGTHRFSIFQQRTQESKSTPLTRAGSGWYWQKNGNRFLIAGLTQAQAEQIARSIK